MKYLCLFGVLCFALVSIGCEAAGAGALEAGAAEGMAAEAAGEGAAAGMAEVAAEGGVEGSLARGARVGAAEGSLARSARIGAAEGAGARASGLTEFGEDARAGVRARGSASEAPTGWRRFGDESPRGGATAAELRARASQTEGAGRVGQLNSYTVRVRGAQPFDGITRHFDRQGEYRGYSVHSRDVSYHYDEAGRFDGRTEHRADGSLAWDAQGKFKGRSLDSGNATQVYDAAGKYKGYNTRLASRIYYYDEHGTYTGYSVIEPGKSVPTRMPVVVVPAGNDCNNRPRTGPCASVGR